LLHYYRTGITQDFRSFWPNNAKLVEPRPIPPFTPTRRTFRVDGIVI
jgi:hypothetical protein